MFYCILEEILLFTYYIVNNTVVNFKVNPIKVVYLEAVLAIVDNSIKKKTYLVLIFSLITQKQLSYL